jgi:hypothetical protein
MKKAKSLRDIAFSLFLVFSLASAPALATQTSHAQWTVPLSYKLVWIAVFGAALSAYYATVDSNKQSMDVKDWKFDAVTQTVAACRMVYFFGLNYFERSYIPNHQKLLPKAEAIAFGNKMNQIAQQFQALPTVLSYNSRWDEVVVKPFSDKYDWAVDTVGDMPAKAFAAAYVVANNVLYIVFFVPWWGAKLKTQLNQHVLPNQEDFGAWVKLRTGWVSLGLISYMLLDIAVWNFAMSVKQLISGFLPAPADNSFLRLPDCTLCFFCTNLGGKNGPIANGLNKLKEVVDSETLIQFAALGGLGAFIVIGLKRFPPLTQTGKS